MKTLGPCAVRSFVAQSHTPCNRCVRFATTVASGHATLATKRTLLLTWAGLPPAGSHQLCLAHVAVGTGSSWHAPRPDPYVRLSRIRLLPRVCDGTSCRIRSSACDTRAWF